jgi:hypothetical protein
MTGTTRDEGSCLAARLLIARLQGRVSFREHGPEQLSRHLVVQMRPTVRHLGLAGLAEIALHHIEEAFVVCGPHPWVAHDAAAGAVQALRDVGSQRGPDGTVSRPSLCSSEL